jgi:hypothetical protein
MRVAAVVLAAGSSARFGKPKQFARSHDVVSFDFPTGAIDIDTAADYKKLYQRIAADGTRLG